ncbi:MAG: urease accessory protein UreF [Cucumibacter sp.]
MTWLSPAFPVGAFAFSHGLERAVGDRLVANRADLEVWLIDLATLGSLWNDAVIFAEATRRTEAGDLTELAELAAALAGGKERLAETIEQGTAFIAASHPWPRPVLAKLPASCPYPVAVGAIAAAHGIGLEPALVAWLGSTLANLVQAGVRLVPIGQTDAVKTLAALEPIVLEVGARASASSFDDLGSASIRAEIASLQHETQYSRLFRS